MTISTPVDDRVQPRLTKITVHEQRLVGIVAFDAGSLRLLDAHEGVVTFPLDLWKRSRSGRELRHDLHLEQAVVPRLDWQLEQGG